MKLKFKNLILTEFKAKKSVSGEFIEYKFFDDNDEVIGVMYIRLKKGWNQIHSTIEKKYQGKGYFTKMLDYVLDKHNYVTIPEDRIHNSIILKIIEKYRKSPKYEIWKTGYNEWIISNKKIHKDKIDKIFN